MMENKKNMSQQQGRDTQFSPEQRRESQHPQEQQRGQSQSMGGDTQKNVTQTKKLFEDVFSKGNISALDSILASNIKLNDPARPHDKEGIANIKELEQTYNTAFPNKKVHIDELIPAEDKVIVRWTASAVHKGELEGISPTNKSIKISGISIYRFQNGKIIEITQQWDRLGLLEQIGEIQPAAALH